MKRNGKFEKIATAITRCKMEIAGVATSVMAGVPMIVKADSPGTNKSAGDMVTSIAEIVVDIFPLVGIFFVIAGAFKLIMAYRNDQPEAQSGAAKDIVIGVVLIVFRAFAWPAVKGVIS